MLLLTLQLLLERLYVVCDLLHYLGCSDSIDFYHILRAVNLFFLTLFSTVTIIFGSIGIYLAESGNPGANINNLGEALWWAVGTVTTVAYGDVYPVTIIGKVIATLLMFAGIGILGTFISTLGAKLISARLEKTPSGLVGEAKTIIKEKIDIIEKLDQKDFDALIAMIRTLRQR